MRPTRFMGGSSHRWEDSTRRPLLRGTTRVGFLAAWIGAFSCERFVTEAGLSHRARPSAVKRSGDCETRYKKRHRADGSIGLVAFGYGGAYG
jgi:hypothetical protein